MTASLYTFTLIDGTLLEVNSDQLNYIIPSTVSNVPASIISVGGLGATFTVVNTLSAINAVLPTTNIALPFVPPTVTIFPAARGSVQWIPSLHDPEPWPYRSWEWMYDIKNYAGQDAIIRSSRSYPDMMQRFDPEPYPYRGWEWAYNIKLFKGQDVLPFRTDALPIMTQTSFDYTNNTNLLAAGIPM